MVSYGDVKLSNLKYSDDVRKYICKIYLKEVKWKETIVNGKAGNRKGQSGTWKLHISCSKIDVAVKLKQKWRRNVKVKSRLCNYLL